MILLLIAAVTGASPGRWHPLAQEDGTTQDLEATVGAVATIRPQLPYEDALTVAFTYRLPRVLLENGTRTFGLSANELRMHLGNPAPAANGLAQVFTAQLNQYVRNPGTAPNQTAPPQERVLVYCCVSGADGR